MAMLSCLMCWKYANMLIPRGPTCIVPMPPAMVVPPPRLLMARGLFLCLNQVMLSSLLSRHQGLVLDHCKNEYRHQNKKYTSTWIIAYAMSTRRRMFLVLMALLISCNWQIITSSWTLRRRGAKWLIALWSIYVSDIKGLYHYFSPFSAPYHILHILSLLFLFFPFDGN